MNICTVSFFGHRKVENIPGVEKNLIYIINHIVNNCDYVKFLIGREGEFDWLVSSVISRIAMGRHNVHTVLVLPYMRAGYRDHKENYMCCYNEVEICQESAGAYPKSAIRIRNRSMIERSDIIVCCLQHSGGNTYKYIRYAEKLGKIVLNTGNGKFI